MKIVAIQTNSGEQIAPTLDALQPSIFAAAEAGADLITTPEMVACLVRGRQVALERARPEADHPAIPRFSRWAAETGRLILAGSIAVTLDDGRLANRSLVVGPDGAILARLAEIHMFDVTLANGESYRESETYAPGDAGVVVKTPKAALGMTICYDLRFPALHRALAQAGAEVLLVPSAFTVPTGRAHWEVLLRARAIETGCFVVAPAQTGEHHGGRRTWGHSMIINPWGDVIAAAETQTGVILADCKMEEVAAARRSVPALTHDRPFSIQTINAAEARAAA